MIGVRAYLSLVLVALTLVWAGLAQAQVTIQDRERFEAWLITADRAERVIIAARASNASLEKLRLEIVDFREFFAQIGEANSSRIATLESQLEALGPKPESGDEPEDIATLRSHLNTQLDELKVPRVVSEEAYFRANGMIAEIDQIIRSRQTKRLLERGPSPLNPAYWAAAWSDFTTVWSAIVNETRRNWQADATRARIVKDLPLILGLSAVGLILLGLGKRWTARLGAYLRRVGGRGSGVWDFLVSLARIVLPLLGVVFLVSALSVADVLGVRGARLLEEVPSWALILLMFGWLGDQLYAGYRDTTLLPAPIDRRREMILLVKLLAVTLVLRSAVTLYQEIENLSDATLAVTAFPVILIATMLLFRLHQASRSGQNDSATGTEQLSQRGPAFYSIIATFRRLAVFLALGAPVLAGLGYIAAADAIIFPVILSLAAISIVLILQRFFSDVYALVRGVNESASRDSLFSVLIGFALILAAAPVIALIWGARPADISELWNRFMDGFQVGDARISPTIFVTFALIFVAGYSITKLLQSGLRISLLPKTKIDPGGQNAIVAFTGYLGIFLSALVAISAAGLDLSSVAIVAGALSVGIGFGLQTIVSNFVSGIILLIERPIAKGDWIEVGGFAGYVRDISVRSTRIETFDRADVIVPNSDLIAGTVTNYTKGKTVGRVIVPVGVAYGNDTRAIEKILLEIANAHPMVLANPPPNVVFQGFGADSLDFEIRAILRDVNWVLSVRSDMNHEIAKRFGEAGIEIPFAQRDIWLRNPEVLARESSEE